MIFVECEGGFIRAGIDRTADAWIVCAFTSQRGPVFLSPCAIVPADDRAQFANVDVAWRVALAEGEVAVADCARC